MQSSLGAHMNFKSAGRVKPLSVLKYQTLFWLFMTGSVIGFVLEGLWSTVLLGHWEHHAAVIWGPFCIIYGIGAVAVFVISHLLSGKNLILQFTVYFISGALVEYFGSLFQEMIFGSVSWDYSEHFLNIDGRVSLQMALIWGVLGILFMRLLFPVFVKLIGKLNKKRGLALCGILTLVMALNLLVTSVVISRWQDRLQGFPPENSVELLIDNTYGNERMNRLFPNMRFVNNTDAALRTNAWNQYP